LLESSLLSSHQTTKELRLLAQAVATAMTIILVMAVRITTADLNNMLYFMAANTFAITANNPRIPASILANFGCTVVIVVAVMQYSGIAVIILDHIMQHNFYSP